MYFFGMPQLVLSDPKHVNYFANTKGAVDKSSGMKLVFPVRMHDNLLSVSSSKEQVARRKAMVNAFSG